MLGSNGTGANAVTYNPPVVNVPPPPTAGPTRARAAERDRRAPRAGSLLVLSPGIYNENVLVWKPLKLQGLGPGGIIGAHELQARDPEDPRFNVAGSVIDGRFFQQNATAFDATVAAHAPYAGVDAAGHPVLRGADITVARQDHDRLRRRRTGQRHGVVQRGPDRRPRPDDRAAATAPAASSCRRTPTTCSSPTTCSRTTAASSPAASASASRYAARQNHNYNVRIANDRLIGNGGLTQLRRGRASSTAPTTTRSRSSIVCSNFSVEYGAGISHSGSARAGDPRQPDLLQRRRSTPAPASRSRRELPVGGGGLGDGSGAVDVDRNLIQSNYSGDDGGGIFVLDALDARRSTSATT